MLRSYLPVQTLCCCCALSHDHMVQSDLAGFLPLLLGKSSLERANVPENLHLLGLFFCFGVDKIHFYFIYNE